MINDDDVVFMQNRSLLGSMPTFLLDQLREKVKEVLRQNVSGASEKLLDEGAECEVLKTTGGGWQKGKIRIRFEFIPDEPPPPDDPDTLESLRSQLNNQQNQ